MGLKYKEGCTLVNKLTDKLDNVITNYSQSNRAEIKEICSNIKKFRKSFSDTDDLYEIEQSFDNILSSLLKEEYEEFQEIVKYYRNEKHLLELRENGGTVYVTSADEYYGNAPCDISPVEEMRKQTTVGDIKRMLDEYPDDMIALGECEGGIYNLPSFSSRSVDEEIIDIEEIIIPDDYEHKDMKGEKEFLFFD
jgi:phosphorylcholine metabolism protein LicD